MRYDRIIRGIRNGGKLFDENDKIADKAFRVLGKALEHRRKAATHEEVKRGTWSGLTKAELAQSGTVETDWY